MDHQILHSSTPLECPLEHPSTASRRSPALLVGRQVALGIDPAAYPTLPSSFPLGPAPSSVRSLRCNGLIKSERFSPRMRREEILVTSVASHCHLSCASGLHAPQGQIPPVPFPSRALGPLSRLRPKFSNASQTQPQGAPYTKTGFTTSLQPLVHPGFTTCIITA